MRKLKGLLTLASYSVSCYNEESGRNGEKNIWKDKMTESMMQ